MKHSHYYKDVKDLKKVDIYRLLFLYEVTHPCLQHAIKKLLLAGQRGAGKPIDKDIQEAIDSLERWKEMYLEDGNGRPMVKTFKGVPYTVAETTAELLSGDCCCTIDQVLLAVATGVDKLVMAESVEKELMRGNYIWREPDESEITNEAISVIKKEHEDENR